MKPLTLVLLILALALPIAAQTSELPSQWAGGGVFFNQYAAPQLNGTFAYAKRVLTNGTYSFNAVNFLSYQKEPFRIMTTAETGIAQHVTRFGRFDVYALGTLGLATAAETTAEGGGTATGMAFTGGGLAFAQLGRGWTLGPVLRITKPTISDTQWSAGLMFGWGQ